MTSGVTGGVSGRYASALFDLAREQNELDAVDRDLGKFQAMLDQSPDLNRLVKSPAFAAEDMIKGFRQQLALHRGEMVAEVQSAMPLNDEQLAALKNTLKASYGKDVRLNAKVDPSLLGGLVVKVGSRMFDSSLRTKLMNLKVVLKGTG